MHITEDVLESYELRSLAEPAAEAVEEHLLICGECRGRAQTVQAYLSAMRSGLRRLDHSVVWWQLHLTDEGLVEIWIQKTPQGRSVSHRKRRCFG